MDHSEKLLFALAGIFVLGVGTQWIAWRIGLPAILLLLTAGCIAGPVTGLIQPEVVFGDLLLPIVSLSVGLILFEGGLNLRFSELRDTWRSLLALLTVGVAVTWGGATAGAMRLLGLPLPTALLLGAILVVTGPTVIGPLLRDIRPTGRVSAIARWEGITIDPVGATLALLVFEAVESIDNGEFKSATVNALIGLAGTAVSGTLMGISAAWLLVRMLQRFWIPDYLQNPMTLMLVVGAFATADAAYHESGLLAVTVMGVSLANQRQVVIRRLIEFKESLTVLLIAVLFILLSARMSLGSLTSLGWRGPAFAGLLIVVVRPAAVSLATIGSGLTFAERLFLSWMAPRGIVAAAVSSVFALRLGDAGTALAPATFIVIFITVAVYGLTAGRVSRRCGLSVPNAQGLLFAGANRVAREIAKAVKAEGFPVVLVDTRLQRTRKARDAGLTVCYANVLSDHILDEIDFIAGCADNGTAIVTRKLRMPGFRWSPWLIGRAVLNSGLGRFLGFTSNDEINTIAVDRFRELFGRENVYQLPQAEAPSLRLETEWQRHLAGRTLFSPVLTYEYLDAAINRGAKIKVTRLTDTFGYEAFQSHYGERAWPLFVIDGKRMIIVTSDIKPTPKSGQSIVSLVESAGNVLAIDDNDSSSVVRKSVRSNNKRDD